jgi:glutaredoxin
MANPVPLLLVVGLVAAASWLYRRTTGVSRPIDAVFTPAEMRELGLPARAAALLLFTAPGCPPCTVAKRLLDDIADRHSVPVVIADVTEHHAIAAQQHVYRAPTVFVVDQRGHAVSRITGVPRPGEVEEALATPAALAA